MQLRKESVVVSSIGPIHEDGFGWVIVDIASLDFETSGYPNAELRVPLKFTDEWTVKQVKEAAISAAAELVKFLESHLSESDG